MSDYLVHHYLDNASNVDGKKIAVCSPTAHATYEDLLMSSNKLANCLLQNGVKRQDRVLFSLKRSPECIVAIMAILKADSIYVPIDPNSPAERWLHIIHDCRPSAIICDSKTQHSAIESLSRCHYKALVIVLEDRHELPHGLNGQFFFREDINAYTTEQPIYRNIDSDIAYILYTSGSTGAPKGVMVTHLNITNYINWAVDYFKICSEDVILSTAPFHFDMSTFDIFSPLKAGASLAISTDNLLLFPKKLIHFMNETHATIWKGVSSLLMYIVRTGSLKTIDLPSLRTVIFAGEVLPTKYLIEWMQRLPGKQFYNGYGPTEGTGMSSYYFVKNIPEDSSDTIPIGKACANTEIFLLTEQNSLAKEGEIGELCIRGSGVAKGYWNDWEKTAQAFVPNPLSGIPSDLIYRSGDLAVLDENGNYVFIGRKDDQVKWMGYRIELGEIKNALLSLDTILDAHVFVDEREHQEIQELVAVVEVEKGGDAGIIMSTLKERLPAYMIPTRIVSVSRIPRTDRGKIDRKNIKKLLQ